jgi:hypothetical protein
MEKAFFLLAGTVLGWLLNTAKEVWLRSRGEKKELDFISVKLGIMLDKLTSECALIVQNVFNEQAYFDQEGNFKFDRDTPTLCFHGLEIDWRVLDAKLTYKLLRLESDLEFIMKSLNEIFIEMKDSAESRDLNPNFLREALSEERVYRLSIIGRESYRLSKKVKKLSGISESDQNREDELKILENYPKKPHQK